MPDFNSAAPEQKTHNSNREFDPEALTRALRAIAARAVPELFPKGVIDRAGNKKVLRLANINGDPPKGEGSCVIHLTGDHAFDWYDHTTKKGGRPFSTLKERFGLAEGEVYTKAAELIEQYGGDNLAHVNGHETEVAQKAYEQEKIRADIQYDLSKCGPLAGSPGQTYWGNRKLGALPPAAYLTADGQPGDLLFGEISHYDLKAAFPAIVGRFRLPDGKLLDAIQRVYLERDFSWHIGRQYPKQGKKSRGRTTGGVIMLAPRPNEAGELGFGEGIETTAAGMAYFGVPGWATAGNGGMVAVAEWLLARKAGEAAGASSGPGSPADLTCAIKRLLIWADWGKAGETSAAKLTAAARQVGIAVNVYFAQGDGNNDLADDLMAGLPAPQPLTEAKIAALDTQTVMPIAPAADDATARSYSAPQSAGNTTADLERRITAFEHGTPGDEINATINDIVAGRFDPVNEDRLFTLLWRRTGVKKTAILEIARDLKANIVPDKRKQRDWLDKVAVGNDGEPKPIMSNIAIVLRDVPEFQQTIGFNEFTGILWVLRNFPWEYGAGHPCDRPWTDDDELAVTEWMQQQAGIHARRGDVFDAVRRVSAENKFHPVKNYLNSVRWDGEYRIDRWLASYCHAPDNLYTREIGARSLFSAVARIYRPGIKADCMTILEGPQGRGKSSAIRVLFDPWFTDQLSEIGTKDSSLELRGIWCAEYSDLDAMGRAEATRIKAFMSRTTDRFRPPYGRVPIAVDRQCVFWGTSNEHEYLKDATGGRRFWPVMVDSINIEALYRDKDQIWAEAVDRFINKKAKWWIDADDPELLALASEEVEARFKIDPLEDVVSKWLRENDDGQNIRWVPEGELTYSETNMSDLLDKALNISDKTKWFSAGQRVGRILTRLGWVRKRIRTGPGSDHLEWVYRKLKRLTR
jgi:predicted P-loop ATPase